MTKQLTAAVMAAVMATPLTLVGQESHADAKAMVQYAEAIRDGKLAFPIDFVLPLASAAEAHEKGEKGGIGKIILMT